MVARLPCCTIGRSRKLPKIISEDFENILETSIFPRYCQNCWKHFWKWAPSFPRYFQRFFSGLLSFSSLSHHDVPCWKYSLNWFLWEKKWKMKRKLCDVSISTFTSGDSPSLFHSSRYCLARCEKKLVEGFLINNLSARKHHHLTNISCGHEVPCHLRLYSFGIHGTYEVCFTSYT